MGKMSGSVKVVFGLAGTAYTVQMLGDRKAVCCFSVYQHVFVCLLTEQTQSNSPSSALVTPEKWQHYRWHTHSELFLVICTRGDKSPMWRDRKGG